MVWIEVAMEEYKSLRGEISDSLKNQHSIINYGITAIGLVIGFGANLWKETIPADIIFLIVIPILCHLIMLVWNGEVNRMSRAGNFIKDIEGKINTVVKSMSPEIEEEALSWETWLRKYKDKNKANKTNKTNWNYYSLITLFLFINIVSVVLGFSHNLYISEGNWKAWFILFTLLNFSIYSMHYVIFRRVKGIVKTEEQNENKGTQVHKG